MALLIAQTTFDEQVLWPPKDQRKVNLENALKELRCWLFSCLCLGD